MLFNPLVGGRLAAPARAGARRLRAGPGASATARSSCWSCSSGVTIELAGFPSGTPLREAMEWVYRNIRLRFMRTTHKAAPLVALGVAGLLGLGGQVAWARMRARARPRAPRRAGRRARRPGRADRRCRAAAGRGTAIDEQLTWKQHPRAWTDAGGDLDRGLPRNSRAMVLPGQIFAFYTLGRHDRLDPAARDRPAGGRALRDALRRPARHRPALDRRPARPAGRLLPGQLLPLLRLMGAGRSSPAATTTSSRSGAVTPPPRRPSWPPGSAAPRRAATGPARSVRRRRASSGPARELPQVRRYDVGGARGIVHVAPVRPGRRSSTAPPTAWPAWPRSARCPTQQPILYAGDLTPARCARRPRAEPRSW